MIKSYILYYWCKGKKTMRRRRQICFQLCFLFHVNFFSEDIIPVNMQALLFPILIVHCTIPTIILLSGIKCNLLYNNYCNILFYRNIAKNIILFPHWKLILHLFGVPFIFTISIFVNLHTWPKCIYMSRRQTFFTYLKTIVKESWNVQLNYTMEKCIQSH